MQSLAVGPSEREGMSRIITVIPGTKEGTSKITKQLYKLIHVEQVSLCLFRACQEGWMGTRSLQLRGCCGFG